VKYFARLLVVSLLFGNGCGGGRTTAGAHQPPSLLINPPQPSPATIIKASVSRQLIIKFKPDTISCNPAGIAELSLATHVSLEFVRPMSGDACVVKQFADSADGLLRGQKTLKDNSAVEYLEPDSIIKALQ
jgi:hypothetical protein